MLQMNLFIKQIVTTRKMNIARKTNIGEGGVDG